MRCYRKILCISCNDHVTNKEVHSKIQQAIRPHECLLTMVKRCKLQWYGYVSHSLGLAKTIFCKAQWKGEEDKADGGRSGKTTTGNGHTWSLPSAQRAVENMKKWRKLAAKSSVVPKRPSRLRDKMRYKTWYNFFKNNSKKIVLTQ